MLIKCLKSLYSVHTVHKYNVYYFNDVNSLCKLYPELFENHLNVQCGLEYSIVFSSFNIQYFFYTPHETILLVTILIQLQESNSIYFSIIQSNSHTIVYIYRILTMHLLMFCCFDNKKVITVSFSVSVVSTSFLMCWGQTAALLYGWPSSPGKALKSTYIECSNKPYPVWQFYEYFFYLIILL